MVDKSNWKRLLKNKARALRIPFSPSKAAQRLKEYLNIFDKSHAKRGKILRYDIYRRAGKQWQTDEMIEYLKENSLITGARALTKGYHKTEEGEICHDLLKNTEIL